MNEKPEAHLISDVAAKAALEVARARDRTARLRELEPLLIPWNNLPPVLCLSRASLARMRVRGAFGPEVIRAGRKLLVRADELRRWVDAGMPNRSTWIAMQGASRRQIG